VFAVSGKERLDGLNARFQVTVEDEEGNLAEDQVAENTLLESLPVGVAGAIPGVVVRNVGSADEDQIVAGGGMQGDFGEAGRGRGGRSQEDHLGNEITVDARRQVAPEGEWVRADSRAGDGNGLPVGVYQAIDGSERPADMLPIELAGIEVRDVP